ncbi:MAG TPA: hypothetical protein PLN94_01675, partial [Thiolinea sp.]|nr:hypothetical protein [Thiolinea sp.]
MAKRHDLMAGQLAEHRQQQARSKSLLKLAMFITFLLYLLFNLHLYLGDALSWASYFSSWQSIAGFLFVLAIAVLLAGFLSWVKHHAYLHFGLYGSVPVVLFTVIGFALFAEFFSSSANQDAKSQVLLGNNAAYQQTLQAPATMAIPAPIVMDGGLTGEIAAARQTLARCEENVKRGREKHCEGDRARLEALEAGQQAQLQAQTQAGIAASQAQAQANLEALKLNHARQDQLKADSYNPVIVMMAKFMAGFSGQDYAGHIKTAVVLVMLVVAVSFEILHHFLSHAKARADQAVMGLDLELARMDGEAIRYPAPADVATPAPRPVGFDWQPEPKPAATTGRIEGTRQDVPRFRYQQRDTDRQQDGAKSGFIGFWDTGKVKVASPAPAPRPRPENRISNRENHPHQGTREEQLAMPLQTVREPQGATASETPSKPPAGGLESLYGLWVAAVQAGECKPSVDATWKWIQKRISAKETGSRTHDRTRISNLQKAFFARAMHEGLMTLNPAYRNGGKKYLWKA